MERARTDDAKDARRAALLDAALEEFFDRGFAAARMDDIARRAGVSKGALYLYFDTKDALFRGLLDTIASPNIERVIAIVGGAPSALAGLDTLAQFAPKVIRNTKVPRLMKVVIGDANTFPEVVQAYRREVIDRGLAMIADMLRRGHARGEIVVDNPVLTARLVVAPIVLSALWQVVFARDGEAEVDLDALFALHAEMLKAALTHDGQEGKP